jgi:hypothetical protein
LKTVTRGLAKYKLHLLKVQEAKWQEGGTEQADDNNSSMEMGMLIIM